MASSSGEDASVGCRAIAFFYALDPWRTCWRFAPGSIRYFDAAERQGLISREEAESLSKTVIDIGADIAAKYKGCFASYFFETRVENILKNSEDLEQLSETGLAIAGAWVDRLYEACPGPIMPERQFAVNSFRNVFPAEEVEFYAESPWLAWAAILDLNCLGPWIGLKSNDIAKISQALHHRTVNSEHRSIDVPQDIYGQKVTVPILSRGLQGMVSGLFYNVPKERREPILTTLLQFGETMGDVYANLRIRYFLDALSNDLPDDLMARHLIKIVSPVDKLILQRNGARTGYRLMREKNYFAGYAELKGRELDAEPAASGFFTDGPYGARIYIEPLADMPNLDALFTRIQLENLLSHTIRAVSPPQDVALFSLTEAQNLLEELETACANGAGSFAKLRQLFAVSRICKNWDKGSVRIGNNELKGFIEDRLGREINNGYQATSFTGEFGKLFSGKLTVAKATRNAISISWTKTG